MSKKVIKKICLLGEFAVGKSSLMKRYVLDTFSDVYKATIGAQVMKKEVKFNGFEVSLMIWDLIGFLKYEKLLSSYTQGSEGCFVVFDVTREETFRAVEDWTKMFMKDSWEKQVVIVANKMDLEPTFEFEEQLEEVVEKRGWNYIQTSAKTGEGVDEAFKALVSSTLEDKDKKFYSIL